jgi:putative oxidoreductase
VEHVNFGLLVLRAGLGVTIFLHGYAKVFLGGRLKGAAGWFESMGVRPGHVQARMAAATELGTGTLMALGLLTPFAAAGIIGLMVVAGIASHRGNGYYIYRPGEGWEYVLVLGIMAFALGTIGPGEWSLDNAIGIEVDGWWGALVAGLLGVGGGVAFLAAFWRPPAKTAPATS